MACRSVPCTGHGRVPKRLSEISLESGDSYMRSWQGTQALAELQPLTRANGVKRASNCSRRVKQRGLREEELHLEWHERQLRSPNRSAAVWWEWTRQGRRVSSVACSEDCVSVGGGEQLAAFFFSCALVRQLIFEIEPAFRKEVFNYSTLLCLFSYHCFLFFLELNATC